MDSHKSSNKSVYYGLAAVASLFLLYTFFKAPATPQVAVVKTATATVAGDSKVKGTVTFSQTIVGGPVTVKGRIEGLDANSQRGFHVHALGDLSGGCASAGSHYNPFGATHGSRSDTIRHVGDLGNIQADKNGIADFEFEDAVISLNGPLSVVGRTLMVHSGKDDLGRGDNDESKKTGNAGGRAACGVIGFADLA